MIRKFIWCVLFSLLCFGLVHTAAAGVLEDRLINEAINGDVDVVRALLEKGANVNAKDSDGETALMKAAYYGYADVVRVLIEKGASADAKNRLGETALQLARLKNRADIVDLLQNALQKDPQARFTESVNEFQHEPSNEVNRERLVQSAAGLSSPPAIPDDAKQLFLQATAIFRNIRNNQTSTPEDIQKPIYLLKNALMIAPWWGKAYYNLSRAEELSGQYDDAIKQLNYYLELKPSDADTTEARTHLAVIQSEKEADARKKQENESVLAVKYVSGGATRLRFEDAPGWWHGSINTLYGYFWVPEEEPFYANIFRMPSGRLLAIILVAQSNNGAYAGDRIGIYDITDNSCIEGNDFAFSAQDYMTPCGGRYYVKVSDQPNATVTVTYPATGGSVTLPVALLYRGRALKGQNWPYGDGKVHQGGTRAMVLHFDDSVVKAAEDPTVNAAGLTPTTVKPE